MRKYLVLFFVLAIGTLFFNSCSKRTDDISEATKSGILLLGNGSEPESLDPHIATGVSAQRIISSLLEGLVVENPKTLAPEPGMAKSWKVSKDDLVWTFNIRENAKWSNGDPVTANDFVYSVKRVLSPGLGAQNAYMLYAVKNAKEYNKGEIKDFTKVGVKAENRNTLKIFLSKPTPYFLSLLTNMAWLPVDSKVIGKYGKIDQRGTKWSLPKNYVSNGPFKLKSWRINKNIVLLKNQDYWDAKNVKLNEVKFYPVKDNQTEERAFRSGQLHVTYTVPTNKIKVYEKESPNLIRVTPYLGTYYLIINVRKSLFKNAKLREALALALDRKSLAEKVVKGGKKPAWSFTPPNTAGYYAGHLVQENVKQARKLLAEAGYPNGKGLPTIQITYNTSNRNRRLFEAVQAMWRKNLNINVSLVNKEWKVYLDTFKTKNFEIAGASWIGDYADPNTFLDLWETGAGNNRAGWSNKKYDLLIRQASTTRDQKKRFTCFKDAETILIDEAPIIPIYFYTSLALIKPSVHGWNSNVLDHHPLKYVSLVAEKK